MAEFPPRTPDTTPNKIRGFYTRYFGMEIVGMLAFLAMILSVTLGFFGFAWLGFNPYLGAIGTGLGAGLGFNVCLSKWIKIHDRRLDEVHRDRAANREAETQRQIAEMKRREQDKEV